MARLTVIGIGNVLMSDEGVGVRLLEAVRDSRDWPEDIEFIDGGAGGLNLLNVIEDAERLVVFDAADMKLPPGRHRVISPEQIAAESTDHYVSMHDVPFLETLKLCERLTHSPDLVRIMAIQPATIEFGRELSGELNAAFEQLSEAAGELVRQTASEAGLGSQERS